MKKLALPAMALAIIALGVLIAWPIAHWRLYDALAQPLALTQAENYCSGYAVADSGFDPAAPIDKECLKTKENVTPNIGMSVQWGCEGINAVVGEQFPVAACVDVVEQEDIWFLLHGGYTWAWDETWTRPVEAPIKDEAERGASRGDFGENAYDTTTTTTTVEEETTE